MSGQRVLITGASGFIGKHIVERFSLQPDWQVYAATRSAEYSGPESVKSIVLGDLAEIDDYSGKLDGIDCIIHCAGRAHILKDNVADPLEEHMRVNCHATIKLAQAAKDAKVSRFIFISSIGVNGNQTDGTPFTHDASPAPESDYAKSKLAAEEGLLSLAADTDMQIGIIRPPLVTGVGAIGNVGLLTRLIKLNVPLPFALAKRNKRSVISVKKLSETIVDFAISPSLAGPIFLVAEQPPLSTRDILKRVAEDNNTDVKLFPVPIVLLKTVLYFLGKRKLNQQLFGDLEITPNQ